MMKRSILQFVGFACGVAWAMLLSGTLLTTSVQADPPSDPGISNNCRDCYACDPPNGIPDCRYSGVGTGCTNTHTCICVPNNGSYLCQPQP